MKKLLLVVAVLVFAAGCVGQAAKPYTGTYLNFSGDEGFQDFYSHVTKNLSYYDGQHVSFTGPYSRLIDTDMAVGKYKITGFLENHIAQPGGGAIGIAFDSKDNRTFVEDQVYTIAGTIVVVNRTNKPYNPVEGSIILLVEE